MCSERTSADTVTTAASTALELDDIQLGMLHQRPASYVGTYLLLRIDNRDMNCVNWHPRCRREKHRRHSNVLGLRWHIAANIDARR